jgi:hypothetical protein
MTVTFQLEEDGVRKESTRILSVDVDASVAAAEAADDNAEPAIVWRLAEVRGNDPGVTLFTDKHPFLSSSCLLLL